MKINVRDFSKTPGARYKSDGSFSGEQFYEEYLRSAFAGSVQKNEKLVVDLDGTEGFATSFLDEAFGRLAEEFGTQKVLDYIEVVSDEEPDWVDEIKSYILERK